MSRDERVFYVPIIAADGPALIPHTRAEYLQLWHGVDREAAFALIEDEFTDPTKEP